MLAHEDALQIVPAADVDIVPVDADEVKALALRRHDARGRHWKAVFSCPDLRTDLRRYKATFLGEFSM